MEHNDSVDLTPDTLTDARVAQALAEKFHNRIRYCEAWNSWAVFDGTKWATEGATSLVFAMLRKLSIRLYKEALRVPDSERRKEFIREVLKLDATPRQEAVVRAATRLLSLQITPDDFDRKPWLLNVKNGTVNLKTGQLQRPSPADYMARQAGTVFDSSARCPRWELFLKEIFAGNADVIAFIQRSVGYTLTGSVSEQVFWLLYGLGSNGKSKLLETIYRLLGTYAVVISVDTILRGRSGESRDVARLPGVRFAQASEPRKGSQIADDMLKILTGDGRVATRKLYREGFDFDATHKLWIAGNHKPTSPDSTESLWRRVQMVRFPVSYRRADEPADDRPLADKFLDEKLAAELPGILNWALEGCRMWQENGLGTPSEVVQEGASYRAENDPLYGFIGEVYVLDPASRFNLGEVHAHYEAHMRSFEETPRGKTKFSQLLKERGCREDRTSGKRFWVGLRAVDDGNAKKGGSK